MGISRYVKVLAAVLVIFGSVSLIGGCSGKEKDKETSGNDGVKLKAYHMKYFIDNRGQDPTKDRVLKEIEKKTNVSIEFVTAPAGEESSKLNMMINGGDQLDLAFLGGPDKVSREWAKQGALVSYDDYVKKGKYPAISSIINSDLYKDAKVNGKSYFKLMPLWPGLRGYMIRQDWLDKVGKKIPTNIDEFYDVMKAFAKNDPDGNKKDDTFGFYVAEPTGSNMFGYIYRAFAVCGGWGDDWVELPDGKITQFSVSDQAKDGLRFIKKLYDENIFNTGFANEKDAEGKTEDLMVQGKMGIMDATRPNIIEQKFAAAGKKSPMVYLPPLAGKDVKPNLPHSGGYWGAQIIPKTCKDPKRVLDFLEWALTEEGRELTMYGIDGIHFKGYEEKDGMRVYNINKDEMAKDWNTSDYGNMHPYAWGGFNYCEAAYLPLEKNGYNFDKAFGKMQQWVTTDESKGKFVNWFSQNLKYAIPRPFMISPDDKLNVDSKLYDIIIEGRTKCIVDSAKNFDKNWNDMVNKWMAQGGKQLLKNADEYIKEHK